MLPCLILQGRYDEAEAALKRALEIDPRYTIAKKNLADLPEMRRIGGPQLFGIRDPYKEMISLNMPSLTLLEETLHPYQGFFELIIGGTIGTAHESRAGSAK